MTPTNVTRSCTRARSTTLVIPLLSKAQRIKFELGVSQKTGKPQAVNLELLEPVTEDERSHGLATKPDEQRKDDCSRQEAGQNDLNKRKVDEIPKAH